jgi:predicted ferric reductase
MRNKLGAFTVIILTVISVTLWILSKNDTSFITQTPVRSLNQLFAILGVTLISIEGMLAARIKFIEKMFGGLDQVYSAHRVFGTLGMATILQHPVMLILNVLPNTKASLSYLIPDISSQGNFFGIIALYLFLILIIFSIFIKLPYHIWKLTHMLMGVAMIGVLIHVLLTGLIWKITYR